MVNRFPKVLFKTKNSKRAPKNPISGSLYLWNHVYWVYVYENVRLKFIWCFQTSLSLEKLVKWFSKTLTSVPPIYAIMCIVDEHVRTWELLILRMQMDDEEQSPRKVWKSGGGGHCVLK